MEGQFQKSDKKRIKVKNCDWGLKEEEIIEWLEKYGSVVVPLTEDVYDTEESDDGNTVDEFGTGDYWLTMELETQIPQFLPMFGKKIEIYYRGMEQLCLKCYRPGHKRVDCENEKREWMDYVVDFIKNNNLREEMYGKWTKIARKHRRKQREGGERPWQD